MTLSELKIMAMVRRFPNIYGLEIVRQTKLKRGSIYVTLQRMEKKQWLTSVEDDPDPIRSGIARRRYTVSYDGLMVFYRTLKELAAILDTPIFM